MRELMQSKPKVFVAIITIVLILVILSAVKMYQSKPAIAHAEASEQTAQPTQLQGQSQIVSEPAISNVLGNNRPIQPVFSAQSSPPPSKTNTSDENNVSINPQNTWHPEIGVLIGHTTYDASGNACGKGPTGICMMPFAGRTIELRDSLGNLSASLVSDSNGAFSCKLKPGTYTVIPGPGEGVNPTANSQQVTVTNGSSSEITLDYWAIAMTNSFPVQGL